MKNERFTQPVKFVYYFKKVLFKYENFWGIQFELNVICHDKRKNDTGV